MWELAPAALPSYHFVHSSTAAVMFKEVAPVTEEAAAHSTRTAATTPAAMQVAAMLAVTAVN